MDTSFYILMGILACLSLFNLLNAKRQRQSKARTLGMWFNGLGFVLIIVAIIIAVFIN